MKPAAKPTENLRESSAGPSAEGAQDRGPESDRQPAPEFSREMAEDRTISDPPPQTTSGSETRYSNGNRQRGDDDVTQGPPEKGGPGAEAARQRQPPDAER